MKSKLSDMDKLKFWLDSEITILHIMFYVVMWLLTHNIVAHVVLALLIVYSMLYFVVRVAYMAENDKDYLKVPTE